MRLTQPETAAREQIVTVGQAIRREVAAMGDGVERALARAAELEALVHNEVSALERAYNDNEVRIRDLLTELTQSARDPGRPGRAGAQRHRQRPPRSRPTTSPRSAIWSPTRSTKWRSASPARSPRRASTSRWRSAMPATFMIDTLTERGSTLLDRLETTSDRATTAIASASDRLSASLNFKTEHVHDEFAELAVPPAADDERAARPGRAGLCAEVRASPSKRWARARSSFSDALTETGSRMAETIAARAEEVNYDAAFDRRFAGARFEPARRRRRLQDGADRRAHHRHHRRAQQHGRRYLPRKRRERWSLSLNSRGDAVKDMLMAPPAGLRGHVQPRRHRAHRKDFARRRRRSAA